MLITAVVDELCSALSPGSFGYTGSDELIILPPYGLAGLGFSRGTQKQMSPTTWGTGREDAGKAAVLAAPPTHE